MSSRNKAAFTLVELLIVVVIIAILAAITIVAYNGIQNRARASAASSALSQAAKKLELYKVDNSAYPTSANLASAGITNTNDTTYQYTSDGTTYCLTATNVTISYYLNSTTTPSPTAGGCPGHGVGGAAAVTNLAIDPRATQSTSEWGNRYSMARTFVVGATDGPISSITTYMRNTQGTAATGGGRGVDHHGNLDILTPDPDTSWPVSAGDVVSVSIYTRSSLLNNAVLVMGRIHNGSGTWLSSPTQLASPLNYTTPGSWVRLSGTLTVPSTGYLDLATRYQQSVTWTSGATIDFTGLMVTKGSGNYNYADPTTNASWVWNGTANASSSTGPAL